MTREEIYMFEHWLELGFAGILDGTCPLIYTSRAPLDLASPRVEIKAIAGGILNHSHNYTDGTNEYDSYEGTLEITVATNRTGEQGTMNHAALIGSVRSRLTMRYLTRKNAAQQSNWQSPVIVPLDIRATGTADTFFDGNDIDITALSYYLAFNVKPDAWPDL